MIARGKVKSSSSRMHGMGVKRVGGEVHQGVLMEVVGRKLCFGCRLALR